MKTLQANNLNQAVKELKKIDETIIDKVKADVKDVDKKHYHVILVKVIDRPGQAKNKVTVSVQTYNKPAYEKLKKNFAFQGFTSVILLHDPSQLSPEDLVDTKTEKKSDTVCDTTEKDQTIKDQADQIAELKAQLAAKETGDAKDTGKDNAEDTANKSDDSGLPAPDVKGDVDFDVEKASFKELNEFAAANEIELNGARSTDAIREVVTNWLTEKRTSQQGK